ncbi:hypothetical protein J3458_003597 [Metarhizium acridum]|uniref:uncharacterized protein n=1 Tax=Metarhizium acridum TaxID=92637 RepID=UPI001C6B098B|nr:hypothetical protein J3458_003597 [Metarhizium acridum]
MYVGPQLGGQKALPIVDISFWNGCPDITLPVLDFISADVCRGTCEWHRHSRLSCRVHGNGRISPLPSPLRRHMTQVKGIERRIDPCYCIYSRGTNVEGILAHRWPGYDVIPASLAIMNTFYRGTMERWRRGCTRNAFQAISPVLLLIGLFFLFLFFSFSIHFCQ